MAPNFRDLSDEEKAGLVYAADTWTQREVAARYRVTVRSLVSARDRLVGQGVLEPDGTVAGEALDSIPGSIWKELRDGLAKEVSSLRESNGRLYQETVEMTRRFGQVQQELEQYRHSFDKNRTILNFIDRLEPFGVNSHWIRAAATLMLIELVIKEKLEEHGHSVEGLSAKQLQDLLDEVLKQREGRKLSQRLTGLHQMSDLRNKMVHTGHRFANLSEEEADAVELNAIPLMREILGPK